MNNINEKTKNEFCDRIRKVEPGDNYKGKQLFLFAENLYFFRVNIKRIFKG